MPPVHDFAIDFPARIPEAHDPAVRLSLVVPTLNEADSIGPLLDRLVRLLDAELPGAYELIVVDDESGDGTWDVASERAAACPRIRVARRTGERGLASAVVHGWQLARGEVLGVIDSDLQHEGNDAAGKGGAIRRVTGALDARYYNVVAIAAPTEEERAQPYLWHLWRHVPRRGHFTIFGRS